MTVGSPESPKDKKASPGIVGLRLEIAKSTKHFLQKIWGAIHEYVQTWVRARYWMWFLKKKWQFLTYTHLSHYLALVLTIIIAFRERAELWEMIRIPRLPCDYLEWLVIIGSIGTGYAFWLEHFEKQRAISDQELRFQIAVHGVLKEFTDLSAVEGTEQQIEAAFVHFTNQLVELASTAFSLPHKPHVHVGLLVKNDKVLELKNESKNAGFDKTIRIPIPEGEDYTESGPAALAFKMACLVYVPRKGGTVWPLRQDDSDIHRFQAEEPRKCWVKSAGQNQENFQTLICAPVPNIGILNFTTKEKDAFVTRDFSMALYFANTLSYAADMTGRKAPTG